MGHYASVEKKSAPLSSDFGREFLIRRFGQEMADMIIGEFGLISRGPRKGKPRGYILWDKCTRGGWKRTGPGYEGECSQGYVMKPGTHNVRVAMNPDAYYCISEDAAKWQPPVQDEHFNEVARNRGIDVEAIRAKALAEHHENLKKGLQEMVEKSKTRRSFY